MCQLCTVCRLSCCHVLHRPLAALQSFLTGPDFPLLKHFMGIVLRVLVILALCRPCLFLPQRAHFPSVLHEPAAGALRSSSSSFSKTFQSVKREWGVSGFVTASLILSEALLQPQQSSFDVSDSATFTAATNASPRRCVTSEMS